MKIALKDVRPNPFRNLDSYPLNPAKVEELVASIKATDAGFWDNILVRRVGDIYELAYGHHRLEAAKRAGLEEANFIVKKLSDADMLKVMILENQNDIERTPVSILMEGVEATVAAIAAGTIEVKLPKNADSNVFRYAPSFIKGVSVPESGTLPYTTDSIASFLGIVKKDGHATNTAKTVVNALELIEKKLLTKRDVLNLAVTELDEVIRAAVKRDAELKERIRINAAATAKVFAENTQAKEKMDRDAEKLKARVSEEAAKIRQAEAEENDKKAREAQERYAEAQRREKERQAAFAEERKALDAKLAARKREEDEQRQAEYRKAKQEIQYIVKDQADEPAPRNTTPAANHVTDNSVAQLAGVVCEQVARLKDRMKQAEGTDLMALKRTKTSIETAQRELAKLLVKLNKV